MQEASKGEKPLLWQESQRGALPNLPVWSVRDARREVLDARTETGAQCREDK